jgi:hypothetical protein
MSFTYFLMFGVLGFHEKWREYTMCRLNYLGFCRIIALLFTLLIVEVSAQSDTIPVFDAAYDYRVVGSPYSFTSEDFNNDDIPDLVVSGEYLQIFLGNGNGTFKNHGEIPGTNNGAVADGDFNGDGEIDLAFARSDSVFIFLGQGDGTFTKYRAQPSSYSAGWLGSIITYDFNKDNKLDIAIPTCSGSINGVNILLGNGDGTINEPVLYSTGSSQPRSVTSGDFNKDGNSDLAVVTQSFWTRIFLGNGDGIFYSGDSLSTGNQDIKTGDFNNDGKLDVATNIYGNSNDLLINFGNGDGTFTTPQSFTTTRGYERSLTVADLNGDNNLDIAVPGCSILFGNGNGTFQNAIIYKAGYGYTQGIISKDLTGDGKLDIIVGTRESRGGGFFSVLINKGNGNYYKIPSYSVGMVPECISAQDLNKDGYADLVTSNFSSNSISVLLGNGNGTFKSKVDYPVGTSPASVVSSDLNNDGKLDLAVANMYSNSISVLLGNGDGTLQSSVNFSGSQNPVCLKTGDFDNDGNSDVAVSDVTTEDGSLLIFKGYGNGTLQLTATYAGYLGWAHGELYRYCNWLTVGDFNKDGNLDIAATSYTDGHTVKIFLGNGDFTFSTPVDYAVTGYPSCIIAADLNEDGNLDLSTADAGQSNVSILLGIGDGTFHPSIQYQPGGSPYFLAAGDIDNDNHTDLIVANYYTSNVSILYGKGDGTVKRIDTYGKIEGISSVALGDFDRNGGLDIAAVSDFSNYDTTYIFLNKFGTHKDDLIGTWAGQGVYYRNSDSATWVKLGSPADLIAAGDLDGDGTDDLVGIWPSQGGVWVKYSQTGAWAKLSSTARHITTGDMNGDGRVDLVGTWDGQGTYYRNSITGAWVKLGTPGTLVTTGDLDGDGTDDLIGIWPSQGGVWVKYSHNGAWAQLSSTAVDIATGDMNGDGRADLVGTWDGQGTYYRNSVNAAWVKLGSPATQVAAGDLDGDGTDDLIGIWPSQGGVWAKYSKTGTWEKLSSTPIDIATGKMRGGATLDIASGPVLTTGSADESAQGPGGMRFMPVIEENTILR